MISSADNDKVKNVIKLKQKKRFRDETSLFVSEGETSVAEIPTELIKSIFVSEDYKGVIPQTKAEVLKVAPKVFEKISDTVTPQGILAVVKKKDCKPDEIFASGSNAPVLFLERLQDPGNLGTIVRMAEAAGVAGIIMSSDTADIYNPKTVRATMGSLYRVPFSYCDDMLSEIENAKGAGFAVYAATLSGAKDLYDCDYTKKSAFIIGNESAGVSAEATALADENIKIPMEGRVESLNAAMAATIICFEAKRQRGRFCVINETGGRF